MVPALPRRLAPPLAGALALAGLVAGCGGGTTTVIVHKPTPTTPTTTPSTTVTTTTPTATTPTQPTGPTLHESTFQSPTGNIGCDLVGGIARCDLKARDFQLPHRPVGCPSQVDFGQGLEVGRAGPGRFVCAGDTTLNPSAPTLQYGSSSQAGSFRCDSASAGMTCTNTADGHGFFISRVNYRLF